VDVAFCSGYCFEITIFLKIYFPAIVKFDPLPDYQSSLWENSSERSSKLAFPVPSTNVYSKFTLANLFSINH
jgi:hypothetical protein